MPLIVYRASECSSKNAVGSVVVVVVVFVWIKNNRTGGSRVVQGGKQKESKDWRAQETITKTDKMHQNYYQDDNGFI